MSINIKCDKCNRDMYLGSIISKDSAIFMCVCGNTCMIYSEAEVNELLSEPDIKRTEVIPVREEISCRKCKGKYEMVPETLMTNPPKYKYICKGCGHIITLNEQYPRIVYKDKTVADKFF